MTTSRCGHFVTLCRRLKKLPPVKEKVKSGELGYTAARVLVPVIDQTNEKGWLDFALNNSRRDLEREVKRARKEAVDKAAGQQTLLPVPSKRPAAVVPVRVSLAMTPTQFARYEGLWERIRKQNEVPTDGIEALLEIMESFAGVIALRDRAAIQTTPRGGNSSAAANPPVQIHIHQCPECRNSTVQTSKGELEIGEAELERAQCDCRISRPNKRNTASILPTTWRKVLAHYRHSPRSAGSAASRNASAQAVAIHDTLRFTTRSQDHRAAQTTRLTSPASAQPATACCTTTTWAQTVSA